MKKEPLVASCTLKYKGPVLSSHHANFAQALKCQAWPAKAEKEGWQQGPSLNRTQQTQQHYQHPSQSQHISDAISEHTIDTWRSSNQAKLWPSKTTQAALSRGGPPQLLWLTHWPGTNPHLDAVELILEETCQMTKHTSEYIAKKTNEDVLLLSQSSTIARARAAPTYAHMHLQKHICTYKGPSTRHRGASTCTVVTQGLQLCYLCLINSQGSFV